MADGTMQSAERGQGTRVPFMSAKMPTLYSWLGNMGWPILLKQLRINFRRNRFFIAHFLSLLVLGCILIVVIATQTTNPSTTPSQVGQAVFAWFLGIQSLIVLVLFPVFGSTGFTEEKSNLSYDFLLISTLKPREIVWGKFLSTSLYCLMFLIATIPLLSISFLFGGVRPADVVQAYVVLLGVTFLLSMFALWVSSLCTSNVRSTMTVYSSLCLLFVILWWWRLSALWDIAGEYSEGRNLLRAAEDYLGGFVTDISLIVATAIIDAVALFTYLFLFTTNRVRPLTDDRTSRVRLFTCLYLPLRLFLSIAKDFEGIFDPNFVTSEAFVQDVMVVTFGFAAVLLLLVALIFPTEDANISRRVCEKVQGWGQKGAFLRIFAPGPFAGFIFTSLVSITVCLVIYWTFFGFLAQDVGQVYEYTVHQVLVTLPIYIAAFSSLGFLLSVSNFTPLYSRLTVVFVFIISLLLPMIFWLVQLADRFYYFYYISPIVLWKSLAPDQLEAPLAEEDEISYQLWGIPIITISKIVFGAATFIFMAAGIWIAKGSGMTLWSYRFSEPKIDADALEPIESKEPEAGGSAPSDGSPAEGSGSSSPDDSASPAEGDTRRSGGDLGL